VVAPVSPEDQTPRAPRQELIGVFDTRGLRSIDVIQKENADVAVGQPSKFEHLQLKPGQTGPLTVTAKQIDESKPMAWSFEAKDVAGNARPSAQCPTDNTRLDRPPDVR